MAAAGAVAAGAGVVATGAGVVAAGGAVFAAGTAVVAAGAELSAGFAFVCAEAGIIPSVSRAAARIVRVRIVSLFATLSQLVLIFKTSIDQPLEGGAAAHGIPDRHAKTCAFRGKQLIGLALAESRCI